MKKIILGALTFVGMLSLPAVALAATFGVATTNVNLRAGPSTAYPAVDVVPRGDEVRVYGCLSDRAWCDVRYDGLRGWMSSRYLAFYESGRRYVGPQAIYRMHAPVITFSFGSYWDNYYRGRPFYRDRSRWERHWRNESRDRPHWDGDRGRRSEQRGERDGRRSERNGDRRNWVVPEQPRRSQSEESRRSPTEAREEIRQPQPVENLQEQRTRRDGDRGNAGQRRDWQERGGEEVERDSGRRGDGQNRRRPRSEEEERHRQR